MRGRQHCGRDERWVAPADLKGVIVKEEDRVPCAIYKQPRRMLVKVGSGNSGDTFELKGAEWADVEAGSHDAAVRAQARKRPKYAAIAAARAST